MRRAGTRALTLAFIGLTAAMLFSTFGLSRVSGWIPQAVLAVTLALLLLQSVFDWRAAAAPGALPEDSAERRRRAWAACAWIGGLLLTVWLVGVVIGSALFCCAWLRWHAGEGWRLCGLFAVVLGMALWLVFGVLLRAELYAGLVRHLMT